ncbi:hypothetical protein [Actinokineospora globicatena]|uniref:hypothetical protein n=1 Tax=Actinokineospora globicatena TaxID=103729 RepID=UPI0020A47F9F|nr:hypothetical protein [Actinokineospora globicatena]MCP2302155.1 hypothetical protein [Actinokineospora globicatena]GLW76184.1 hypothetical protein Aglo01_06660 [Actinokineospora globicatena]GLW83020.1 hypothetical protein Aglo02_06600 [Actinokineospora globicatena]
MTRTLIAQDGLAALWAELPRLIDSAHGHVDRHPALEVASLDVCADGVGAGRVEIYVSGSRSLACARLLDWLDTLTRTSLCLQVEGNPQQPRAMVFGRLHDGTSATVIAPLAEEDAEVIVRDRIGDWVLHWLRLQAVDAVASPRR